MSWSAASKGQEQCSDLVEMGLLEGSGVLRRRPWQHREQPGGYFGTVGLKIPMTTKVRMGKSDD